MPIAKNRKFRVRLVKSRQFQASEKYSILSSYNEVNSNFANIKNVVAAIDVYSLASNVILVLISSIKPYSFSCTASKYELIVPVHNKYIAIK